VKASGQASHRIAHGSYGAPVERAVIVPRVFYGNMGWVSTKEIEIACDESGSEGENVTGASHRVFVHASVDFTVDEAASVIGEVRRLAPSQAPEYKSEQLMSPAGREALAWLLSPNGPLAGRAHAYLVDKDYFIVGKVVDLLVEEVTHAADVDLYADRQARAFAWTLHRQGARALGLAEWSSLLGAFNSLMRVKQRLGLKTTVDEFFDIVDRVRLHSRRRNVSEVLDLLWRAKPHADDFQARLMDDPDQLPTLDPLIASLGQTVRWWHEEKQRPVRIVHDRQAALTPARVAKFIETIAHPLPEFARFTPPTHITAIDQVDSKYDPRVQVADLLAGASREIASDALASGHDNRSFQLRPFVDGESLWSHDASWRALTGRDALGR